MNVNSKIIETLSPLGYPVKSGVYKGKDDTYIIFNYEDDRGELFSDDEPDIDKAYLQIHLFCSGSFDYMSLKKQIRSRLFRAGFSYPSVTQLYEDDTDKNHIIFQCEIEGQPETEE